MNPVQFEATPAGGAVVLVESGVPRSTVVVPDGANVERHGVEMLAAREWVEHVELAIGAKMAIIQESDAPVFKKRTAWLATRADYVQIVLNGLGAVFDQHSRDGGEWNAEGLRRGVHVGGDFWSLEVFGPFAALPETTDPPPVGAIWFANFIRSRHSTGTWQLTRWSTRYRYSNIDVSAFGRLRFVE